MTATYPHRRRTDARYRGAVYGLDVLDHHTGLVVENDYVGKTRQKGRARENQHRETQPFSDRIVGSARVLWEGMCTEAELDEMERRFIQEPPSGVRPRLNWLMNEDNPHQIPKWVQVEQRHERDDRAGRPRWKPLEERSRESLLEWEPSPPRRASLPARISATVKRWRPWQRQTLGFAITWTLLAGGLWVRLAADGVLAPATAGFSALLMAVLILVAWVLVWADAATRKRRRRNAVRVIRRWLK